MNKLWIVIQDNGDFIQAIGVYDDFEKAIASAFLNASEQYPNEKLSALFATEGDTGSGFFVFDKNGKKIDSWFILIVDQT